MNELTFDEIWNIGNWKPYRPEWIVDRNLPSEKDGIQERYGRLINSFEASELFETIQYQDGGMSNYLEFICFKRGSYGDNIEAIDVYINLCAPIGTFGQINFFRDNDSYGFNQPESNQLGQINSRNLKPIENEIIRLFLENEVTLIEPAFLNSDLEPTLEIKENLLEGEKMFNYLFQWID